MATNLYYHRAFIVIRDDNAKKLMSFREVNQALFVHHTTVAQTFKNKTSPNYSSNDVITEVIS